MNEMYFDWGAPMDAGRNDPVIGVSEWGTPVYRSSLGHTYWREKPRPKPERKMGLWEMMPAYTGELETTRKAPDGVSQPSVKDAAALAGGWLLGGLDVPRRALAGEPVRRGDVMATALDAGMMAAPMTAPKGALRAGGMADDAPKGIKAYHGSPHDFDRFSMDKIGTGEGAQAYGHGLYFADSEDVAKVYRDAVSAQHIGRAANWDDPKSIAEYWSGIYGGKDGGIKHLEGVLRQAAKHPNNFPDGEVEKIRKSIQYLKSDAPLPQRGHMYEVSINANPDDFLDWDAPLSDQPRIAERLGLRIRSEKEINDEAYALLDQYGSVDAMPPEARASLDALNNEMNLPGTAQSGRELYEYGIGQQENVHDILAGPSPTRSADLAQAGIPGIKYLDAGSRGAGTGTRNYVVFDENLISILRKYGIGAMVPGAGYMLNDAEYSSVERMQ